MPTCQNFLTLILTNDFLIFPPTVDFDLMFTKLSLGLNHNCTVSFGTLFSTFAATVFTGMATGFSAWTGSGADYLGAEVAGGNLGVRAGEKEIGGSEARAARGTAQFLAFVRTGQNTFAGFFAC
jgi:hypothetical protein